MNRTRSHRQIPDSQPGRAARTGLLALAAALLLAVPLGLTGTASATPITSPGGGESFNLRPGDNFRVGYDFTIPGNKSAVTVTWSNPLATVNFTCNDGSAGSFSIPMSDYTVTVSDSKWYPSGDQHSPLVYQGQVSVPDGCGNGGVMHQNKLATFTADVVSTPANVKISYRFHDAANNASGSWSATKAVITSSSTVQTIQGEIYECVDGQPSTTLVADGSLEVPELGLSGANPLGATSASAGTFQMAATAPYGWQFIPCGQSNVDITSPTTANQDVTVPAGGAGDGAFYALFAPPES